MTLLMEWTLTSGALILAVLLLRALLGRRISAGLRYALWAVVLIRLLVPVQIFRVDLPEPVLDLLDRHEAQTADSGWNDLPQGEQGAPAISPAEPVPPDAAVTYTPIPDDAIRENAPAGVSLHWRAAAGWLWLGGAAAMGLALVACNARFGVDLRRRRRPIDTDCALPVYAVEDLESPCLFGVIRPAVYVTPEVENKPAMLRHVLAHELTHARHGDHIWSVLRCAALAIHWWNPLVWLAAFLSRRDGELACDEGTIKRLGDGERKAYGWTLLTLITGRPVSADLMSCATTMCGGKRALWERVQRIAHARKRAAWAAALAIVLALAVTACAFSSASAPQDEPGESPSPVTGESPEPAQSEPPAVSADPAVVQAARQALYRVLTEAEDIEFSSGNRSDDHVVNPANVTDLWPALGENQGGGVLTPKEFTVLDLDGDGVDEAVLRTGDADGCVFVLHCENGGVRGYYYYIRWFNAWALKADGTAPNSSSAAESGVGRLRFPGDGTVFTENVLYQLPVDGDWSDMRYTVNGEEVSEAEYNAALEQWDAQPEAPWYGFTQENLDALLGGAGDGSLTAPDNSAALAAYQDILNGRAGFLFGEETRTVADIPTMFDGGDSSVRIQRYTLADLDRDGEDEMVLCVCGAADDMEGHLVLNREAGQMYGYQLGFRGDIELRADGTYFGAYSSADSGAYRLDSQGGEVVVAARVPNYDLNNSEPAYVVEGETVDRETFEAAYRREKAKPEAQWQEMPSADSGESTPAVQAVSYSSPDLECGLRFSGEVTGDGSTR